MKKITLPAAVRERLARQIAENAGVVVDCNGALAAPKGK